MKYYFYSNDGGRTRKGPYTAVQIESMRQRGILCRSTMVWSEELPDTTEQLIETNETPRRRSVLIFMAPVILAVAVCFYLWGGKDKEREPLPPLFPESSETEAAYAGYESIPEEVLRNVDILQRLHFTRVSLEEQPVVEALAMLQAEAEAAGLNLNVVYQGSGDAPPIIHRLELSDVSAQDVLKHICAVTACSFRVEKSGVVLYPKTTEGTLPSLFPEDAEQIEDAPSPADGETCIKNLEKLVLTKVEFKDVPLPEALDYLLWEAEQAEIRLPLVYKEFGNKVPVISYLKMSNVSARVLFRAICMAADYGYRMADKEIVVFPRCLQYLENVHDSAPLNAAELVLLDRLSSVVVPAVCFDEGIPTNDVLDFLRAVMRQAGKPVDFEWKAGASSGIAQLQRENITALDLLNWLCDECECVFRLKENMVVIKPDPFRN